MLWSSASIKTNFFDLSILFNETVKGNLLRKPVSILDSAMGLQPFTYGML